MSAVSGAEEFDRWVRWYKRRKVGRLKVSRSIPADVVWGMTDAWLFSSQVLGLNLNRFITVRPRGIDDLTPRQRIKYWEGVRNKIAQYARDRGFECAMVWSRESDAGTGKREHLHVLTHVPPELHETFTATVEGWFGGTAEIDVRRADYRTRWTLRGKRRSAITYITKNSPQAAWGTDRSYRKGGPILGKRAGCSRNIDARARAHWTAASYTPVRLLPSRPTAPEKRAVNPMPGKIRVISVS